MSNTREELVNRFFAINGAGKVQSAVGTAQPNGDLDTRDKCVITREEVVNRRDIRDCRNEDLTDSQIITRMARYTLQFAEVTPQILARYFAWFMGGSAAPTGTPQNETQTVTVASDGTLSLTLEGRTVTTKTIASAGITAAKIQAALTTSRMFFIHPGDISVTGTGPFVVEFTGRLANANIPTMSGSGGFSVAATQTGAQNFHALTRATARDKKRISFALGFEDNTATIEKYIDYVVESFQPQGSLTEDPSLTVTIIGPWDYDSLEPSLSIPACVNPDPLRTEDCRVEVNSVFQTQDLNSESNNLNDNVPVDRQSAFAYDGIEVQTLNRGKQPTYNATASVIGVQDAATYILAQNERTQTPVEVVKHYGMPGNRFSLIYPNAKIRFQNSRETFIGAAETAVHNLEIVPLVDGVNPPVKGEAYVDQATQFLISS